jgi:hypothetical protein
MPSLHITLASYMEVGLSYPAATSTNGPHVQPKNPTNMIH